MIRTQVYLTQEERQGLSSLAAQESVPVASLIRAAIDQFLQEKKTDWKEELLSLAGIWQDRDDLPDFELIRKEGDRLE